MASNVYVLDTETYQRNKETGLYEPILDARKGFLGCIIQKGKKKPWFFDLEREPESMWNFIIERIEKEGRRDKTCEFWAHNHHYDFICYAQQHLTDPRIRAVSYKPFIHILNEDKEKGWIGSARMLDSANFFKMKLARLGEEMGFPKLEMPREVLSNEQVKNYCVRDCEILLKALEEFRKALKGIGYNPKRFTSAPRLAMTCFMNTLADNVYASPIGKKSSYYSWMFFRGKIHQTNEPEMLHMASRGGRIEMFAPDSTVHENIFKLDVKSQYPYVCSNNPFPDPLREKTIENPDEGHLDMLGVSEATVEAPATPLPYLPTRYKRTIYPAGCIMRGFWTNHELKRAIEEGYKLVELHKSVVYEPLPFNPFKPYYEKLYDAKEKADPMLRQTIKLLMNSLTGKFAYRKREVDTRRVHRLELQKYIADGYEPVADCRDGYVIMTKEIAPKTYAKTSNPIFYAYITAYARDMLYKHMKLIPTEELLYCVTDCIIFKNEKNLEKFNIGKKMGQWEIQDKGVGQFWNEHYYRINDNILASGATKKNVTLAAIEGREPLIREQMQSLKTAWNTGRFDEAGTFVKTTMHLEKIPKRRRSYPDYIQETPPSRMVKIEDIIGIK